MELLESTSTSNPSKWVTKGSSSVRLFVLVDTHAPLSSTYLVSIPRAHGVALVGFSVHEVTFVIVAAPALLDIRTREENRLDVVRDRSADSYADGGRCWLARHRT